MATPSPSLPFACFAQCACRTDVSAQPVLPFMRPDAVAAWHQRQAAAGRAAPSRAQLLSLYAALTVALAGGTLAYVWLKMRWYSRMPKPERRPRDPPLADEQCSRSLPREGQAPDPLARLAVVERQLILQYMDVVSLLALSRCSRQWRRDAQSRFAWSHAPPICVAAAPSARVGAFLRRVIPQHASLMLRWRAPVLAPPAVFESELPREQLDDLLALHSAVPLWGLDITHRRAWHQNFLLWVQLHEAGLLKNLRRLEMRDDEREVDLAQMVEKMPLMLAAMPHLHTLVLDPFHGMEVLPSCLHMLPSLTALRITDTPKGVLAPLTLCSKLRRLHLCSPRFFGQALVDFCSSSIMRGIEHLTLERLQLSGPVARGAAGGDGEGGAGGAGGVAQRVETTAAHLNDAFAALRSLETLHLRFIDPLLVVLAATRKAPRLRHVLLEGETRQMRMLMAQGSAQQIAAIGVVTPQLLEKLDALTDAEMPALAAAAAAESPSPALPSSPSAAAASASSRDRCTVLVALLLLRPHLHVRVLFRPHTRLASALTKALLPSQRGLPMGRLATVISMPERFVF